MEMGRFDNLAREVDLQALELGGETMNSFKIVGHGKTRSDETSEYIIEVSPKATVNEVLVDIVNQKSEWGRIGIKSEKEPFFGEHHFEYRFGRSEIPSKEDQAFWNSIMQKKVVAIKGRGGWSNSDYQLVLED